MNINEKSKKSKKKKKEKGSKKNKEEKEKKSSERKKVVKEVGEHEDEDDIMSLNSLEVMKIITHDNNHGNNDNKDQKNDKKSKKHKDKKKTKKRKRDKHEEEVKVENYKPKKKNKQENAECISSSSSNVQSKLIYPYPVDNDDHCETPLDAYNHLVILLEKLCEKLNKTKLELKIWDPFYCTGKMQEHLIKLGFNKNNIYNKCEDFYQKIKIENGGPPEHDCIITNPPYSENHMESISNYCYYSNIKAPISYDPMTTLGSAINKPCFILMPSFVMLKQYWINICNTKSNKLIINNNKYNSQSITFNNRICYVAPRKRYQYSTPYGRRQAKSGVKTSPFPSIWYRILDKITNNNNNNNSNEMKKNMIGKFTINDLIAIKKSKLYTIEEYVISTSTDDLPIDVLPEQHPIKRKEKNKRKRIKNKANKKNRTEKEN